MSDYIKQLTDMDSKELKIELIDNLNEIQKSLEKINRTLELLVTSIENK